MSGSSVTAVIFGVLALGFGVFNVVSAAGEETARVEQIASIGQEYEQWAIQNPAQVTELLDGEPYSHISKEIIDEDPVSGLAEHNVFYFGQYDGQYGLCFAKIFDTTEESTYQVYERSNGEVVRKPARQKAYLYSTVTEQVYPVSDCAPDDGFYGK